MYWMADTLGLDNSTPSWTPVRLGTPRTASMGHGQRVTPTELLQRSTLRVLGRNLPSWSFGLAGGAWSATTGDPLGLVSAALGLGRCEQARSRPKQTVVDPVRRVVEGRWYAKPGGEH